MKPQHSSRRIASLILTTLFFGLVGCGGGTTGSGGGSVQFSGALTTTQGAPLAGVNVQASALQQFRQMAQGLGNTAITDDKGAFTLALEVAETEQVKLEFTGTGINSSYVVPSLPQGTAIVKIELDYDDQTDEVSEKSIKYEDDNGHDVEDSAESGGNNQHENSNAESEDPSHDSTQSSDDSGEEDSPAASDDNSDESTNPDSGDDEKSDSTDNVEDDSH